MANNIAVFCTNPTQRRELIEFLLKYGYHYPSVIKTREDVELYYSDIKQYPFIWADANNKTIHQISYDVLNTVVDESISLIEFIEAVITQITKK